MLAFLIMLFRGIRYISLGLSPNDKSIVSLTGGYSFVSYSINLLYAVLPVIFTIAFGSFWAGFWITIGNLLALIISPIIGNYVDSYGSKRVTNVYAYSLVVCGLLFFLGYLHMAGTVFSFLLIAFLSGSNILGAYVLRVGEREKGGLLFGYVEAIKALGTFLATMSIAFFSDNPFPYLPLVVIGSGLFLRLVNRFTIDDTAYLPHRGHHQATASIRYFIDVFRYAFLYLKKNKRYPIYSIMVKLWEGIFYGAIWFLLPMHLFLEADGSGFAGIGLGIYELITIFFASLAGMLADRYSWKFSYLLGQGFVFAGLLYGVFHYDVSAVVIFGIMLGLGNNLIFGGSGHALEAHDQDHQHDGSFASFQNIVSGIGYFIMPIIIGAVYQYHGFLTSWYVTLGATFLVSASSIYLLYRFRKVHR